MVAARPSGTYHVEQVEPAGFSRKCGCIGPSASGRTRPPERAALPGAWSRSRGTSASSPSSAPASPLRETGQIPARREPVRGSRRSCLGTRGAASRRPGRKGPGSTGLGGRAQDRCRPHGTWKAAVRFSQSSAGIPGPKQALNPKTIILTTYTRYNTQLLKRKVYSLFRGITD
ncbi:hypothetical protein NDU88_005991 [Pleurodeles waltl]|uniref:Uncharacterized protein n=1 Tax=Pleurodeles waltl TaxID=8319 RepID=A0AAV7MC65_PLEWA|nr:hypothetical protein NDU88_005991 [Pleurodeles waltl]